MMNNKEIFTIGYSTFSIDNFIKTLQNYKIDYLIDVRSKPVSRHYPKYNKRFLEEQLSFNNINYRNYKDEFGARQTDTQFFTDNYLDFQKFTKSEKFLSGASKIESGMYSGYRFVLMCAEKRPETCHRCIMIARHFYDKGYTVKHILADGSYQLQSDIESLLVNKYFSSQLSIFENPMLMTEMINKSYILQNKEIGYKINN
ncbi:MAG: DUF488 domain-containing protein [Selenomonadaceae bacterium]|nr:DUF488 domain-containing protein [Selenomonadaceae bacterium]